MKTTYQLYAFKDNFFGLIMCTLLAITVFGLPLAVALFVDNIRIEKETPG